MPTTERLFFPRGRIGRLAWIARFVATLCVFFGPIIVTQLVFGANAPRDVRTTVGCSVVPIGLGCVAFQVIQDAKRLHDLGQSGWWVLLAVVPMVSFVYMLVLAFADGQPFTNAYGPDPKGRGRPAIEATADVFR